MNSNYKKQIKQWFKEYKDNLKKKQKFQGLIGKISKFLEKNPNFAWRKIYHTFNLKRKTREEQYYIRKSFNL